MQGAKLTPGILGGLASPATGLQPSRPQAGSPRRELLVQGREDSPCGADRPCDPQTQCRFYGCVIVVFLSLQMGLIRSRAELRAGTTFADSGWKVMPWTGAESTQDGWNGP